MLPIEPLEVNLDHQPVTKELAQPTAHKDANNDVAVKVHGEQHDDVGAAKREGVDEGANELLERRRAEVDGLARGDDSAGAPAGSNGNAVGGGLALELTVQEVVILLAQTAEELDEDDEEDDADAGGGHHALVLDLP